MTRRFCYLSLRSVDIVHIMHGQFSLWRCQFQLHVCGVHKECFQASLLKTLRSKRWEASPLIVPVFCFQKTYQLVSISWKRFGYLVMVEMPVMWPNRTSGRRATEEEALGWNFKKPILKAFLGLLIMILSLWRNWDNLLNFTHGQLARFVKNLETHSSNHLSSIPDISSSTSTHWFHS